MNDPVLEYLREERLAIIERIQEFVRIPSISTDPAYDDKMEAARRFLEDRFLAIGLTNVRRLEAGGQPALYGEWLEAEGSPTILIYAHYDVQPPDPLELWNTPPFEPKIQNECIWGRGVSDDKAPSLIALETLAAFLAVENKLPANVKVLFEGEEEVGSASLPAILDNHRELLAADAALSADGARWREDLLTVNVGSRGSIGFEFSLITAAKDLHSGRYGGAVANALHVMARLLATLHDERGAVAVDGFEDGIQQPSDAEQAHLAEIPFDEASFLGKIKAMPAGNPTQSVLERLWLRPCLDVNGIWGGFNGPGSKTVIPNTAHAKLTLRLVPGQDPDTLALAVRAHLERACPTGAHLTFTSWHGGTSAYEVPDDHPLLLAVEDALEETRGERPRRVRIGATLPLSDMVRRKLGLETVMFSFSTADEDFHAPNEFFRLASLEEGLAAWVALFRRLHTTNFSKGSFHKSRTNRS